MGNALLTNLSSSCCFFLQILRALEGGSAVLKDLTGKTTADEVANVMDNLADVSLNQVPAIHNRNRCRLQCHLLILFGILYHK